MFYASSSRPITFHTNFTVQQKYNTTSFTIRSKNTLNNTNSSRDPAAKPQTVAQKAREPSHNGITRSQCRSISRSLFPFSPPRGPVSIFVPHYIRAAAVHNPFSLPARATRAHRARLCYQLCASNLGAAQRGGIPREARLPMKLI